jgi:hypothetical protein
VLCPVALVHQRLEQGLVFFPDSVTAEVVPPFEIAVSRLVSIVAAEEGYV